MICINVYDFDNTIYDGESLFDFYLLCIKHHPKLVKYLFVVLDSYRKYKKCKISPERFSFLAKKYAAEALCAVPDLEALTEKFWIRNKRKLKGWYKSEQKTDDIVVSATFGFLLRPALEILGIKQYVCSEINLESAKITQICFKEEKIRCFEKKFPGAEIENFYTDSLNDEEFMKKAQNVYLVKHEKIIKYDGYKHKRRTR